MAATNTAPTPASPVPSHWIARVLIAVLLAEGIWGLIVSLTRDLLVPFLAQQMGADPQSPLYLGKGMYNFPALFIAVLQLCFAGIVAAALNAWVNRGPKAPRVKTIRVRKVLVKQEGSKAPAPAAGPLSITAPPPPAAASIPAGPATGQAPQAPPVPPSAAVAPAPAATPSKPQKPKEVYYNIVGEPINPTEDE